MMVEDGISGAFDDLSFASFCCRVHIHILYVVMRAIGSFSKSMSRNCFKNQSGNVFIMTKSEQDLQKLQEEYEEMYPHNERSNKMSLKQWPEGAEVKLIKDNVYGSINVPHPINVIIDTVPFQRLRELKQTGLVSLVFPNCEHSRFVHSLGVFHLCYNAVDGMKRREPHLEINSEDHLSACIAGLLHDVGHGPFCHLFDGEFARAINKSWKHEDMSKRIVDYILMQDPRVRSALEPYLGTGKHYEKNVEFIKEAIGSKRFKDEEPDLSGLVDLNAKEAELRKQWAMVGRGIEKSFLYDIVSNSHNGHDVDKMDYLLRDSQASGIPIGLNHDSINRIFQNMRVVTDPFSGLRKIGYSRKTLDEIKAIGDSRQELHGTVYQHKVVRGIETIMIKALVAAAPFLEYKGTDRNYKLSEVTDDVEAFLRTSDFIEKEIMNSTITHPDMLRAQELLMMIKTRDIPKKMGHCEVSPIKAEKFNTNNTTADKNQIGNHVKAEMKLHLPEQMKGRYTLLVRELGKGLDVQTHPIERQLFYDNKSIPANNTPVGFYLEEEYVEINCPQVALKWDIFVVGDRHLNDEERKEINVAFLAAIKKLELISPRKRRHSLDRKSNARRRIDENSRDTVTAVLRN